MADSFPETTTELLRQLDGGGALTAGGPPSPSYCAQVKLFARTQYTFYVAFQVLVLGLAVAVAIALIVFVIRLVDGIDPTGVLGILGALATGAAAGYLQTQASAAKTRYDEARSELAAAGCP